MTSEIKFYSTVIDDLFDQGDPNIMEIPETHRSNYPFRYYVFITDDSAHGRTLFPEKSFPCYGSNDLVNWQFLSASLEKQDDNTRWAPCVGFYPDLERPFVMLYSRARGKDYEAHIQHRIRRADSVNPEGPYQDSGEVLTQDLDFSIDPQVYRNESGQLRMAFATDFVEQDPIGTGLADIGIQDDLRSTSGPLRILARASYDWQMYEPERVVPWKTIPGVDFSKGDKVRWHCLEGPVGGIIGPTGRRFVFYSAGNFNHTYAVGILEETPDGKFHDLSSTIEDCLLKPEPSNNFFSVGRIGFLRAPDGRELVTYHARFGSPGAPRRFGFAPLSWTNEGLPICKRTVQRSSV